LKFFSIFFREKFKFSAPVKKCFRLGFFNEKLAKDLPSILYIIILFIFKQLFYFQKTFTESQKESLLKELKTLNLTKYISEVVSIKHTSILVHSVTQTFPGHILL